MILEIDLHKFKNNFKKLKEKSFKVCAVVKANAYGYGAVEISKILKNLGCESFAVGDLDEALEIRQVLPLNIEIICLNGFFEEYVQKYIDFNITPMAIDLNQINLLKKHSIPYWLMVDIIMNRSGVSEEELKNLDINNLNLKGLMFHYYNSCLYPVNELQSSKILSLSSEFSEISTSAVRSSSFSEIHKFSNMSRFGTSLYLNTPNINSENIGRVYSKILSIKFIKKGEFVGYNISFQAKENMKIALINCGYSHGVVHKHPYLLYKGIKCPVLGVISMDLMTVDVTSIENINVGDSIDIFNDNFLDISNLTGESILALSTNLDRKKCKKVYINY